MFHTDIKFIDIYKVDIYTYHCQIYLHLLI